MKEPKHLGGDMNNMANKVCQNSDKAPIDTEALENIYREKGKEQQGQRTDIYPNLDKSLTSIDTKSPLLNLAKAIIPIDVRKEVSSQLGMSHDTYHKLKTIKVNPNIGVKAKGKRELLRHQKGERLTFQAMIQAKCYECCGGYADGRIDCKIPECPLYPQMPYRAGGVKPIRKVSEEQKAEIRARFQKGESKAKIALF